MFSRGFLFRVVHVSGKDLNYNAAVLKIFSSLIFTDRLTLSQTTNFRLSKLIRLAEDNFKFDETGTKLSNWLENTVGKGEIARYKQFLLFPQCFQKTCTSDTYKPGLVWERVNFANFIEKVLNSFYLSSLPHNPDF